jgi:hypothetical protein
LKIQMTGSEAANFSNRFVDDLGLDQQASRLVGLLANHVGTVAKEMGIVEGRNPTSTTSAAIWMAIQARGWASKVSHEDISRSSKVAVGTIRDTYRDMYPVRHYLLATKIDVSMLDHVKAWGESKKVGLEKQAIKWAKKEGITPLGVKVEPVGEEAHASGGGGAAAAPGIKAEPGW